MCCSCRYSCLPLLLMPSSHWNRRRHRARARTTHDDDDDSVRPSILPGGLLRPFRPVSSRLFIPPSSIKLFMCARRAPYIRIVHPRCFGKASLLSPPLLPFHIYVARVVWWVEKTGEMPCLAWLLAITTHRRPSATSDGRTDDGILRSTHPHVCT